jgi:hypothetical protein
VEWKKGCRAEMFRKRGKKGCRNAPKERAMCGDASAEEGAMQRWSRLNIMPKKWR